MGINRNRNSTNSPQHSLVWNPTPKENESHKNKILDNILRRTLKVQISTPRETLYIELGIFLILCLTLNTAEKETE